jgi:hypothetical protein
MPQFENEGKEPSIAAYQSPGNYSALALAAGSLLPASIPTPIMNNLDLRAGTEFNA